MCFLFGRVIGVIIGFAITQDAVGAVFGFLLGYFFDAYFENIETPMRQTDVWHTEFSYLFIVLHAKFAKMDGHVTPDEVRLFQDICSISNSDVKAVREIYNLHRKSADGFEHIAVRLSEMMVFDQKRCLSVLESLCFVMYGAEQGGNLYQKAFIQAVARIFSVPDADLKTVMDKVQMHTKSTGSQQGEAFREDRKWGVSDASYKALGLKSSASDKEVRKAYKKAIHKYHPDKVRGAGGTEKEVREAERKLSDINEAYADIIWKNNS